MAAAAGVCSWRHRGVSPINDALPRHRQPGWAHQQLLQLSHCRLHRLGQQQAVSNGGAPRVLAVCASRQQHCVASRLLQAGCHASLLVGPPAQECRHSGRPASQQKATRQSGGGAARGAAPPRLHFKPSAGLWAYPRGHSHVVGARLQRSDLHRDVLPAGSFPRTGHREPCPRPRRRPSLSARPLLGGQG